MAVMQIEGLLDTFKDAREYGSILNVDACDWNILEKFVDDLGTTGQISFESVGSEETQDSLRRIVRVAKNLGQKYDAVVTNPPYMGSSGMGAELTKYVKKWYPDSKSDLFAVFIEKCGEMVKEKGCQAMITQHAWMFLSSFEKLRTKLLMMDMINMAHLGPRAFEEIGGEVVQTTSFVKRKSLLNEYAGVYCRLVEPSSQKGKEDLFLSKENCYATTQKAFLAMPGTTFSYWASATVSRIFENAHVIRDFGDSRSGMQTGDNNLFLRLWFEVEFSKINLHIKSFRICCKL